MKPTVESVLKDAMTLSEGDRARLAAEILETMSQSFDDTEVEAAWAEEIKARIEEIDSGKVEMIPWEQVQEDMRKITDDPQV